MTEESYKEKRYKEELAFRMSFHDVFDKIEERFSCCEYDYKEEAEEIIAKISELSKAWSNLIVKYLTDFEIEQGIIKPYHPVSRYPEAFENYKNKMEDRLKKLEEKMK